MTCGELAIGANESGANSCLMQYDVYDTAMI